MNATLIDLLTSFDPSDPGIGSAAEARGKNLHGKAVARFADRYTNTAFGWDIARRFAKAKTRFPMVMMGKDRWVYLAYLMQIDSEQYYDRHVLEAYALANLEQLAQVASKLKGMIISGCGQDQATHYADLAKLTGLHTSTLEAFEVLFYNVLDRQEDALYVSHEVYPDSRIVEFSEDYLRNTDVGNLIKRAGYNYRDLTLSAYLSGIGDHSYMAKLAARPDREQELARLFMGNALVLSKANLLNQRSVGYSRTATLMAASRQGGQVEEAPPIAAVGDLISHDLAAALSENFNQMRSIIRADAGKTKEVEAEIVSG